MIIRNGFQWISSVRSLLCSDGDGFQCLSLRLFTPVFGWRRLPEFSPPFVHICGTASAFSRLFTYVLSGIAFSTFPSSVYISIWTEMASSGFSSVYLLLWWTEKASSSFFPLFVHHCVQAEMAFSGFPPFISSCVWMETAYSGFLSFCHFWILEMAFHFLSFQCLTLIWDKLFKNIYIYIYTLINFPPFVRNSDWSGPNCWSLVRSLLCLFGDGIQNVSQFVTLGDRECDESFLFLLLCTLTMGEVNFH